MSKDETQKPVALITGSTGGIGAGIAEHLLAAGTHRVVVNGRDAEAGRRMQARLSEQHGEGSILFVAADIRDRAEAGRLFDEALGRFRAVDTFVHAAGSGVSGLGLFSTIDPERFAPLIQGHLVSLLNCCHFATRAMIAAGSGSIITIASDAGKVATPGESLIGAMKAAVIMFTRTLALEMSRHGVRANCVTPSLVRDTPAYDRTMAHELGRRVFEKAERRARLGLPGPEDLAALVAFLASPAAARITGQAISVNGGISAA